jgi:uncharacterized protein (DUF1684 family)
VLDAILEYKSPGALEFVWGGKTYSVDPVLESDTSAKLFLIFKDETSNKQTYAMRYAGWMVDGGRRKEGRAGN